MDVGQVHILVVDDSADGADSTVELLAIWGYDARACYTGASALESARARRPDAVLLDLAMPRMDGFQFAGLFRELPRSDSIPIIVVSGYSGAAYYARAREVGIDHYLLKPADPGRLRELLAWEVVPSAIHTPLFDRVDRPRTVRSAAGEPVLA
jgi:CheY-like chemotaxis protein